MFVERVKKDELDMFAEIYNCHIKGFKKSGKELFPVISIDFITQKNIHPKFLLKDFECIALEKSQFFNDKLTKGMQQRWFGFLSEKFGKEYLSCQKKHDKDIEKTL